MTEFIVRWSQKQRSATATQPCGHSWGQLQPCPPGFALWLQTGWQQLLQTGSRRSRASTLAREFFCHLVFGFINALDSFERGNLGLREKTHKTGVMFLNAVLSCLALSVCLLSMRILMICSFAWVINFHVAWETVCVVMRVNPVQNRYNNQWMVVDYKVPATAVKNRFFVAEQIP